MESCPPPRVSLLPPLPPLPVAEASAPPLWAGAHEPEPSDRPVPARPRLDYAAPLCAMAPFIPGETTPITLPGGRFHRRALAVVRAVAQAPQQEAEACLDAYFARPALTADADRRALKMRHLIHFAHAEGPAVRRKIELLLVPRMRLSEANRLVHDVKHVLYTRCTGGHWNAETMALASHLLQLGAARRDSLHEDERRDTEALCALTRLRLDGDLTGFYAGLVKMAEAPRTSESREVLYRSLRLDTLAQHPAAAVAIDGLRGESVLRNTLLGRCIVAKEFALAQRFFDCREESMGRKVRALMRARYRLLDDAGLAMLFWGHFYDQLVALVNEAEGDLRGQLVGLLSDSLREDLRSVLRGSDAAHRLRKLRDEDVRVRVLRLAVEAKSVQGLRAIAGDGRRVLVVPTTARQLLPRAVMLTGRAVMHVTLGDRQDRVLLAPHSASASESVDLASVAGEHALDAGKFSLAVRTLGFEYQHGVTTAPLAHHSRRGELGETHTLLRRTHVHEAGRVYATLRCADVQEGLRRLHAGHWEAKTLSASPEGVTLLAALHSGPLQVEQQIADLEAHALPRFLRLSGREGWLAPGSYVLADGKHRVLMTRPTPVPKGPGLFARLFARQSAPVPESPEPSYRCEADYANDTCFDGTSVAHIAPEDLVTLPGGDRPYALHANELVVSIVSKAKSLRDQGKALEPTEFWQNPHTRIPLRPSEIETLKQHRHGWPLHDLPCPQ